ALHAGRPEFRALAEDLRQITAASGVLYEVVEDADGKLHLVQGGTQGVMLSLSGLSMGTDEEGSHGRILLRTTTSPIDITDPSADFTAREHLDRTILIPPEGPPVRLIWTARRDQMPAGTHYRAHYDPAATEMAFNFVNKIKAVPGEHAVIVHGGPGRAFIEGPRPTWSPSHIYPDQLGKALPPIPPNESYRMISCEFDAGDFEESPGARLHGATGRAVIAADTTVWIHSSGIVYAAPKDPANPGRPASQPGTWRRYDDEGAHIAGQPLNGLVPQGGSDTWRSVSGDSDLTHENSAAPSTEAHSAGAEFEESPGLRVTGPSTGTGITHPAAADIRSSNDIIAALQPGFEAAQAVPAGMTLESPPATEPDQQGGGTGQTLPAGVVRFTDEEWAAHRAGVLVRVGQAYDAGLASDAQHTIDPGRQIWSADRLPAHRIVIDNIYNRARDVPNEGKAIFSGGLCGAGKTTVLTGHAGIDRSQYLTISADEIKEEMARIGLVPEIDGLSPMEASDLVHKESSYLARQLALRAQADGKNILWDTQMHS
ncbi:MAG: zeta toxin family protein, partial [Streptosporangiaceae bacterium]